MKKSLQTDQRGFGHFMIAFLVVAVIAAVGIIGYRVLHKTSAPADKTTANKHDSDQANCMKVYHDLTLCKFAVNNADLANLSFTAVDNSADAEGQTSQITIKNDGKGNTEIQSKTGYQTYDSITIGNTIYVNGNGSGWIKYTSNAPAVTDPTDNLKTDFSQPGTPKAKQVQYKNLGKEKCGGASKDTCIKYQVLDPAAAGTNYIWIDTSTNRLVRWNNKNGNGTNDMVITYDSVTISAPANAVSAEDAANAEAQAEAQAAQAAAQQAAAQYGQ